MWRKLIAIVAWIPLGWGIREITKTAILDWVTKKLEVLLGLEEAKVIALASTFAVPLSISAIVIGIIYWTAFSHGRQKTYSSAELPRPPHITRSDVSADAAHKTPLAPIIKFDEHDEQCRLDVSHPGEGSFCFRAIIYSSREPLDVVEAYFKSAHRSLKTRDKAISALHSLNLTFQGGHTSVNIYKDRPRHLNILYSSENTEIQLATQGQSSDLRDIFKEVGEYVINITVVSVKTGAAHDAQFILNWSGNWEDTTLSLRSKVV